MKETGILFKHTAEAIRSHWSHIIKHKKLKKNMKTQNVKILKLLHTDQRLSYKEVTCENVCLPNARPPNFLKQVLN